MKLVSTLTLLLMLAARGDYTPYRGASQIEASSGNYIVRHSHDWAAPPHSDVLNNPDSPFLDSNSAAFVELWSKVPERRLWKRPSPALSKLWISPDGGYVVGLSSIAWSNPYQLVVYSRTGEVLHAEHVAVLAARFAKEEFEAFLRAHPHLRNHLQQATTEFKGEF